MSAPQQPDLTEGEFTEALLKAAGTPQLAEVAAYFVEMAGGPRGFAYKLYRDYRRAPKDSPVRQRIMDTVLRALKFANSREENKVNLSLLSDEDLERYAQERFRATYLELEAQKQAKLKESSRTKRCSRCEVEKPLANFGLDRSGISEDGRQRYCQECRAKYDQYRKAKRRRANDNGNQS